MKGHFYKKYCKCPKNRRCTCNAKWYFALDVGIDPQTGKRKQVRRGGFNTRKDAQAAVAKLMNELNDGTYITESNITFEMFAKQWLEMYEASGDVKPSTVDIRKYSIDRVLGYLAHLKLKDITLRRYEMALLDLKKRGYATQSISLAHGTCRMIFRKAMEMQLIKKDPTKYAVIPRGQKTVEELESRKEIPKYLEREELLLLLDTAKSKGLDLDYPFFLTLAYSGMRVGELAVLKWSDLDFDNKTASITKTHYSKYHRTTDYVLLTPKTLSSVRSIDLDDDVLSELKSLRAIQNEVKMKHRNTYHDEGFVFGNLKGKYLGYPKSLPLIGQRMKRLLKLSGLDESLTPHSLRHTHTSLLAEAGASLEEIMERLGHQNDSTTRNIYLHITKKRKKEVSRKFSELMKNP